MIRGEPPNITFGCLIMSLVINTGRTRTQTCLCCGSDVGHPESFDSAVEKAREHVPWLGSALRSSFLARGDGHQKIGT